MKPEILIHRYYADNAPLEHILLVHSEAVRDRALEVARRHPELELDTAFLSEAAMLHDIGILRCDAPGIECHGTEPYICHGLLVGEILRAEEWIDDAHCLNKKGKLAWGSARFRRKTVDRVKAIFDNAMDMFEQKIQEQKDQEDGKVKFVEVKKRKFVEE